MRAYAKQAGYGLEMQNQCAEIKLRAERRGGELLDEMKKKGERKGRGGDQAKSHDTTLLKDLGIDKFQSSRWQAIASIPPADFERHIEEAKAKPNGELTTAALLKKARKEQVKHNGKKQTFDGCTVGDLSTLAAQGRTFGTIYADPPWAYSNQGTRAAH